MGKFDLIAYADSELNLEDSGDLDLGDPEDGEKRGQVVGQVKQEGRPEASRPPGAQPHPLTKVGLLGSSDRRFGLN